MSFWPHTFWKTFLLLTYSFMICGCQWMHIPSAVQGIPGSQSPLVSRQELLSDSVVLEILIIRCPYGDPLLNQELWQDADEQIFSLDLRKRFANNGFRVGVVGNQLPHSFIQLMDMKDDALPDTEVTTIHLDQLPNTPKLVKWNIFSRKNQRNEILATTVKENAMILFNENGTQGGDFYHDVQGVIALKTKTQGDGRVRIEFTPELHYGEMRQKFTHETGAFKIVNARPKKTFESLRGEVTLMPGQIILLSNIQNKPGNLGCFFLTEDENDGHYQKILCIRICQTPHHDMFTRDGVLPTDIKIPPAADQAKEDEDPLEESSKNLEKI
ncbi:MAG: hypothetical protein Q4C96_01205 [Planctomycetia bacterium]|nr:hypothetical protein [Planctomycetia bacterium]